MREMFLLALRNSLNLNLIKYQMKYCWIQTYMLKRQFHCSFSLRFDVSIAFIHLWNSNWMVLAGPLTCSRAVGKAVENVFAESEVARHSDAWLSGTTQNNNKNNIQAHCHQCVQTHSALQQQSPEAPFPAVFSFFAGDLFFLCSGPRRVLPSIYFTLVQPRRASLWFMHATLRAPHHFHLASNVQRVCRRASSL